MLRSLLLFVCFCAQIMTRHSRNCTANSVYSYHEKKRDAAASGYGALAARYGKDGVKDFDCCCLSLHPCKTPVITSEGYLFEREALLEYILTKKNEIRRKTKEYEKQCKKDQVRGAKLIVTDICNTKTFSIASDTSTINRIF